MMPHQSWAGGPCHDEISGHDKIGGLTATIAAAQAGAAAGRPIDLASLTTLIDAVTTRTASGSPESRRAARSALAALLDRAISLADTLDRRAGDGPGASISTWHGRAANKASSSSSHLRR